MSDAVELIPVSERDDAIFQAWESGKAVRVVAREFGIPVAEVERVLDRMLPAFDVRSQLRAFKREIERLESLSSEFYSIAKRDKDPESAHLVARLNERVCAMRGWTSVNIRMDPMSAQVAEQPSSYERVREAIFRMARGPDWKPNDGNGAIDAPSSPDDTEPSR